MQPSTTPKHHDDDSIDRSDHGSGGGDDHTGEGGNGDRTGGGNDDGTGDGGDDHTGGGNGNHTGDGGGNRTVGGEPIGGCCISRRALIGSFCKNIEISNQLTILFSLECNEPYGSKVYENIVSHQVLEGRSWVRRGSLLKILCDSQPSR